MPESMRKAAVSDGYTSLNLWEQDLELFEMVTEDDPIAASNSLPTLPTKPLVAFQEPGIVEQWNSCLCLSMILSDHLPDEA
jgi:hypothetical protein